MTQTGFTIAMDGRDFGNTPIMIQAVNAARNLAKQHGKSVSVIAHYSDAEDREVIYHPDGSSRKIWKIDKGGYIAQPLVGKVYTNSGGGQYLCLSAAEDGPSTGVFQSIKSGWTFTAKGIRQYIDGSIEWDYSVGGRFEPLKEQ